MPAFPVACPTSTSSLAGLLTCCSKLWQLLGTRWGRIRRVGSYPAFNRDANLQRNKKKLPTSGGPGRRVQQRREEVQSCRERSSELERPTDILAGRGRRRRRSSNTHWGELTQLRSRSTDRDRREGALHWPCRRKKLVLGAARSWSVRTKFGTRR